ncbi:MAG TPA: hypothetical protein VFE46_08600 [Pirellulales bacterium]|jgi:hypothetical protein|nr:hypothetical protein [Pirellulales bacterium]
MQRYVEITFDCLPLRSISRLEIPLDASPRYRQRCEHIKAAMEAHGSHNSYYLYNAHCVFHLTNSAEEGMLEFSFEGTLLTDETDQQAAHANLQVKLERETCEWLTEPIVAWFKDTVPHAVMVEFNRYIAGGDLEQAKKRIATLQAKADQSGGYMGMYL